MTETVSQEKEIKAIETHYKGYRFRSRLEARWAVFFDHAGKKWEYEHQGFDLGELGRYLPDFYLPEENTLIEIKPKSDIPKKYYSQQLIYCAGKISKGDWRSTLLMPWQIDQGKINTPVNVGDGNDGNWPTIVIKNSIHQYVGPFFAGCDHGCTHGPNTHGFGESGCCAEESWYIDESNHCLPCTRLTVFNRCFDAIRRCTLFYAWVDTTDCYGTLVEIGMARALGKEVSIFTPEGFSEDDLWFAFAENHPCSAKDPVDGLNKALLGELWKKDSVAEQKVKAAAKALPGFSRGIVYYGDPVDVFGSVPAALVARQARFEHGESPRLAA